jgi:hypothetical protein
MTYVMVHNPTMRGATTTTTTKKEITTTEK